MTDNITTAAVPVKRMCRVTGRMCQFATDAGYCRLTACVIAGWPETEARHD